MAFNVIFQTWLAAKTYFRKQRELGHSCSKPYRVFDGWAVKVI